MPMAQIIRSKRALAVVFLVLLVVLVAGLATGYDEYRRVRQHLSAIDVQVRALEQTVRADPAALLGAEGQWAARDAVSSIEDELHAVQSEAGPLLAVAPYLGWLPLRGSDVAAAPGLLRIGLEGAAAAQEGLDALSAVARAAGPADAADPSGRRGSERVLAALEEIRPALEHVQARLDAIGAERSRIDKALLSPGWATLLDGVDRYLGPLAATLQAAEAGPRLLGGAGPRSYLILAQNTDELRATGGFISSVALVRLEHGRVTQLTFEDSYAVDDLSKPHPAPPEPLTRYMDAGLLVLRDANWWPDFSTSARAVAGLYESDQGVRVDGVVAVDEQALRLLLQALGPVRVESAGETVTASNVIALMRSYWASPEGAGQTGDWWLHRKDFLGGLVQALVTRLEGGLDSDGLARLAGSLRQALDEGHALVYIADPAVAMLLADSAWAGAVVTSQGDYLMVVDSNVGFNKVNPHIQQAVDYTVTLDASGRGRAEAIVGYRHTGQNPEIPCVQEARYDATYEGMMERCYWDYCRLYAPPGSSLLEEQSGEVSVAPPEGDKEVFAGLLVLAPGQQRSLTFRYFPGATAGMKDGTRSYTLTVQKQAGAPPSDLRVRVVLPAGATLTAATPDPTLVTGGTVEYRLSLSRTRTFTIVYR